MKRTGLARLPDAGQSRLSLAEGTPLRGAKGHEGARPVIAHGCSTISLFLLLAVFTQPVLSQDKLLGVELKLDNGALVVVKVIPGGPAARAGLKPGERIVAVDGQATADLSADEVARLLEDKGLPTRLTVTSNGRAPRQLRISREPINAQQLKDAEAVDAAVLAAAAAHNRALLRRMRLQVIDAPVEANDENLRDVLAREVEFMAKVGELTAGERNSLLEQGELAIQRREAVNRVNPAGRRVVVVVNGQNQLRQVRQPETPDQAVRRELTPVLKAISYAAWEKLDAARERLDQQQRRADVLAQVAAFDETLLLSNQQREKFRKLLSARWTDVWRGRSVQAVTDPVRLCVTAAGAMELFSIPEVELDEALRPTQQAAFKLIQLPAQLETVFAEPAPQMNQAAADPAGQNLQVAVQIRQVVRHGLPPGEQRTRLQSLLERLVEDADVQVRLDDGQKQKLLLAGKLDIERHMQQYAELDAEKAGANKIVATVQTQIAGTKVRLPKIFFGSASTFQKTLHSRLTPDQLEKLAEAQSERGHFHRQAVLAALTVALSNRAALTDAQAERVEERLRESLPAPADAGDLEAWRRETLKLLSDLRPEILKPLVDDWQWPAAREYLKEVTATAQAAETQPADPPPAAEAEEMLLGIPAQP